MGTDIVFGRSHGMKTVLVFTGNAKRKDMEDSNHIHHPDYFTDTVANILKCSSD